MTDHTGGRTNFSATQETPESMAVLRLSMRLRRELMGGAGPLLSQPLFMDMAKAVWAQGWRPPADDPWWGSATDAKHLEAPAQPARYHLEGECGPQGGTDGE